jgi:hypothetical protein
MYINSYNWSIGNDWLSLEHLYRYIYISIYRYPLLYKKIYICIKIARIYKGLWIIQKESWLYKGLLLVRNLIIKSSI